VATGRRVTLDVAALARDVSAAAKAGMTAEELTRTRGPCSRSMRCTARVFWLVLQRSFPPLPRRWHPFSSTATPQVTLLSLAAGLCAFPQCLCSTQKTLWSIQKTICSIQKTICIFLMTLWSIQKTLWIIFKRRWIIFGARRINLVTISRLQGARLPYTAASHIGARGVNM